MQILILAAVALTANAPVKNQAPMTDAALRSVVEKRISGDRTGACLAVALVEGTNGTWTTSRAIVCADPSVRRQPEIDDKTTFEIGSITKTMNAALLADLIAQGRLALDSPLAKHLPGGVRVPDFQGAAIRLVHLVTHTAGLPALPSRMRVVNPADPYAKLTEQDLYASLADVTLDAAPGTRSAYSNFGAMVLSSVIARAGGSDLESLMRHRLFRPLGMGQAHIAKRPRGVKVAQGHLPNGAVTAPWTLPVNLAGVGGVRASLADMIRYAEAQLGRGDPATVALLARTHARVDPGAGASPEMGLGWMRVPLGGRTVLSHGGGTGGFSAALAIDGDRRRAAVALSDTALANLGGLDDLAMHLLDPGSPLASPRRVTSPPSDLVQGLAGRYRLATGLGITLSVKDGKLYAQADGQPEFEVAYDSRGDFFPLTFDALLTPRRTAGGGMTFTLIQGGGAVPAERLDKSAARPAEPVANLPDFAGEYPLAPGFGLKVFARDGKLFVQGTGQPPIPVEPAGKDLFVADVVGAELTFERDDKGKVQGVTLRQAGQTLRGKRR